MPLSKALPRQLVPGFLAVCLLSTTMTAQSAEMGGVREHLELGKAQILAVDTVIVWQYVGMLAWPRNLCVLYDPPTKGIALQVVLAAIGWLVVLFVTVRARKRHPLATVAVATFFLFLWPVLNLFPITTLMNDRYLYLPSIPVFALFAAGAVRVAGWMGHPSRLRTTICGTSAAVLICVYATATWHYLPVWRDGLSLWRYAAIHVPQLPVTQIQLANALHDGGRNAEAVAILRATLSSPRLDKFDERRIHEKLAAWK
jgi:hypothetical protein